jgi:hypothetical protein
VCHASNNARGDPNVADVAFQDWPRLLWADFTLATFQEHMFDQCSAPDRLTDRGAGGAAASVRGDAAERRAMNREEALELLEPIKAGLVELRKFRTSEQSSGQSDPYF